MAVLEQLLDQAEGQFQSIDRRWRPTDLLVEPYRRQMLTRIERLYDEISAAEPEFKTLDRAEFYLRSLRNLRVWLRQAKFAWRFDDMTFLQAVAGFYTDYGAILRLLKIDQARGRLPQSEQGV